LCTDKVGQGIVGETIAPNYKVWHGFRLTKRDDYFLNQFWPLLNQAVFWVATGAVCKIGLSLKPKHHWEI